MLRETNCAQTVKKKKGLSAEKLELLPIALVIFL